MLDHNAFEIGWPDPTRRVYRIIDALTAPDMRPTDAVGWGFKLHHRIDTYAGHSRVYFISAPAANLIKIGRSIDPVERLARLQLLSPVPLSILHTINGGSEVEALLHSGFASIRSHGEWFHATRALVGVIAELKVGTSEEVANV